MTHAFPDDSELAKINKWTDRYVKFEYLQHRHRMGDLLNTQIIARSVVEHLFRCRALSIHAHTKTVRGLAGLEGTLDTHSLNITHGTMNNRIFVGITAENCRRIILRGKCADTRADATVLFVEAVLDTSARYRSELLKQMEETANLEGALRDEEGSDGRKPKV